jgi:hypothetical protein
MKGWITEIHLRKTGGSHSEACSHALDAAQILMSSGYDVTLKATLPDIPLGSKKEEDPEGEDH